MKNRFCHKTKLSEEEFRHVVFLYVSGATASDTQQRLQDLFEVKVSRQTITTLFLKLGDYIYLNLFREKLIALYRDTNPDLNWPDFAWEELMLHQVWTHMSGDLDYVEFRRQNATYPFDDVGLVQYLRNRWRLQNGFPHKTLVSHFGLACLASVPIPLTDEGLHMRTDWLLNELTKKPL